jgi:hypothetical protein
MQAAVLDACVLYPAPLRDFFMRLAVKLYQPKWTEQIHEEWMRNVLKYRPDLSYDQLKRTRELMNRHGGACVVTGYESLITSLTLPDEGDRHVLAAAITAAVPLIVTFNLKDFPNQILSGHGVRAVHPDEFALSLYNDAPEQFVALAKIHRQSLVNPPKSAEDYLGTLNGCGLKKTVLQLGSHLSEI